MSKKDKIRQELRGFESEREIKIQSARLMGSRSINAAHEDSDWDVMFLYTFDKPWKYVAPGYSLKTIYPDNSKTYGDIEIFGWNIDRFSVKLQDSDPHTVRFLRSPTTYIDELDLSGLRDDVLDNFNIMSLHNHFRSLAESNYKKYIENGNDKTIGRQFYILHALAYARFVREEGELPPLDAEVLAEEFIDTTLGKQLAGILDLKRFGYGNEECSDIVRKFLEKEPHTGDLEVTDERKTSPSKSKIAETIRKAVRQ